jgi:uncharacterized protein
MSRSILGMLPATVWWSVGALVGAGAGCVTYGVAVEHHWYRRRRHVIPVLPPDAEPLTILHLSDLHFLRRDPRKTRFLASLPSPDVAVLTGDLIGEPEAVEAVVAALRPLRGRIASYFVLGSNDYFVPEPLNYLAYFRRGRKPRPGRRSRATDLIRALESDGWTYVKNRTDGFRAGGSRFEVVGLDDPHIKRHDLRVATRRDPGAVGLAVVHSPDPAPELAALGYDLILSGHTHGGQVRLPVVGALVTNSQMPTRLCMGLSRWGRAYLHISPGLGTSKFAPFRFLCRPEATLIELLPPPVGAEERQPATSRNTAS